MGEKYISYGIMKRMVHVFLIGFLKGYGMAPYVKMSEN